jgi:hypothetical protein
MSAGQDGTSGASLQGDEKDQLEQDDAQFVSETCNLRLDELVIDFCGTLYTVPKGFEFDNASCPRSLAILLSDETLKGYGAALHDWFYHVGFPKCTADGMFRDVLREIDKARPFDHCIMWLAVAFFGRSAYAAHRAREHKG